MPRHPQKPPPELPGPEPEPPEFVILWCGEPALTLEMATERAAPKITSVDGMRKEISRHKVPPIPGAEKVLGPRKKLYLAADIDKMLSARLGTGRPGVKRK